MAKESIKKAPAYYCVGFNWWGEKGNQLERFYKEGIWENGFSDKYLGQVNNVSVGAKLAAKTTYTIKEGGKNISVLEVYAVGVVKSNPRNGRVLQVNWEKLDKTRKLIGKGAYRSTISRVWSDQNIKLIFQNTSTKPKTELGPSQGQLYEPSSLNQIFFGPPGTGKTRRAIHEALAIVSQTPPEKILDDVEGEAGIQDNFEELRDKGQIKLVSFHQSMSYEEFVQGLRPKEGEFNKFGVQNGIFKRLCEDARRNYRDAETLEDKAPEQEFFRRFERLKEELIASEYDRVEVSMKSGKEFALTEIGAERISFEKASGGTGHKLNISILKNIYIGKREYSYDGIGIYYHYLVDHLRAKKYQSKTVERFDEKKYVLIIDEINRGNLPEIFGELISLIDEDKREGARNKMKVVLTYSDEDSEAFSIPPNLYIVGTMNTADRSAEPLDTAMRRRFDFIEVMPRTELLSPGEMLFRASSKKNLDLEGLARITGGDKSDLKSRLEEVKGLRPSQARAKLQEFSSEGIRLDQVLAHLNLRLEAMLGRECQLGHSEFIDVFSVPELKRVFFRRIIPQLREFCMDSQEQIGLLLGKAFFEKRTAKVQFADFPVEEFEPDEFSSVSQLRLFEEGEMSEEEFEIAVAEIVPPPHE